jgi:hypothetical protein
MFPQQISLELTSEEIQEIDFRVMGNLILNKTINLSHAVNNELLEPISEWLDDPHFMDKHAITIESDAPKWAEYKKRQRQWTKQQKSLSAERLRHYWQEIQRKRRFQGDLKIIFNNAQNYNYADAQTHKVENGNQLILSILTQFSPMETQRIETKNEFFQALQMHISNLLPWRFLIADQIKGQDRVTFNSLPSIIKTHPKADKISKFQHLLQMDKDGEITLEQLDSNEPIQIIPTSSNIVQEPEIIIKDQSGLTYEFNWQVLSNVQRNKVIADAVKRKIILKKA